MSFKPVFCRSGNNYDMDAVSNETGLTCLDASLTQQQFKEESDINTIVERFGLTGELPSDVRAPVYADFEEVFDFHSSMNAIRKAEESFMQLPAAVRARFGNDAGAFVDFCSDESNRAEAEKLGLVLPKTTLQGQPLTPGGSSSEQQAGGSS